ncbi:MAG: DUF488 family protein [Lautropia sp.]|nr:DUF488 family protein [Lautropia sp.]
MTSNASHIQIQRVYETSHATGGTYVLVDRLWPRGLRKEQAPFALWIKDVAPSQTLRHWFGHRPERWEEFRRRYREELDTQPEAMAPLLALARQGPLILLYAARDKEHNNAVVLADYLRQRLSEK